MTTITVHAHKPAGGFEAAYRRAPFAELIRLALLAAEAVAHRLRRDEATQTGPAHPAAAA